MSHAGGVGDWFDCGGAMAGDVDAVVGKGIEGFDRTHYHHPPHCHYPVKSANQCLMTSSSEFTVNALPLHCLVHLLSLSCISALCVRLF